MRTAVLPEVGVAIDQPALRESVNRALARSKRYSPTRLGLARKGGEAARSYAAVVTTLAALRAGSGGFARRRRMECPIVVILSDDERVDDSETLEAADAFLSAAKVATLLPAAIMLSAFRMSAIPARFAPGAAALTWR